MVLTVLIIAAFVLQDRYGLMSSQQKFFAKIDGQPINHRKFFQLLDFQMKSIKEKSPHLTLNDFKAAHFPEQVLEEYVGRTVRILELRNQGFILSEDTLVQKLAKYGADFNTHFNHMDAERKKVILEEMRREILEQQLYLPYQLPKNYQKLIYSSFQSDRVVDVITIKYDKTPVKGQPTEDEIQNLTEQNPQTFMTDEKRSFYLINLSHKKYTFTEQELREYYKHNKEAFISSDKKQLSFEKAKSEIESNLRFAKISDAAKNLKRRIENDEINIDDIEAMGYKKAAFKKMTKDTLFSYSLPVLNYAFEQELNVLSDVFEDPATGDLFVIQLYNVTTEEQMKGAELKKAVHKLWLKKKKEEVAKQDLGTLYHFENDPKALYQFISKRNFTLKKDVAVNAVTQKNEGLDPELLFRVFQNASQGNLVYVYTDEGISIARVIKDNLHDANDFDETKTAQYFMGTAQQTVMSAFSKHVSTHHKVEKDIELLYQEIQF